jgi:type VI secretion system protein ImpL
MINQQPLSTRVYGRLKRLLEHDDNLKPVSLSDLGGPQSELVFSRKSGKPVSEGVPGLYTPDGYWKSFNGQIDSVTTALHEDDAWVLGAATAQEDKQQIDNAVRQLYMRDFIANWDRFLATFSSITAPISPSASTPRACSPAQTRLCAVWCRT